MLIRVSGYASVFNVRDSHGDVMKPKAFDRSLADGFPLGMLLAHNTERVIGVWNKVQVDQTGLFVEGEVSDEEVGQLVMTGAYFGLSVGYKPLVDTTFHELNYRELLEVEVIEVSVTATPVNRHCMITSKVEVNA